MEPVQNLDSESGITLVELLIYSMLLVLVLSIVGGLLTSTTKTSKTVGTITQATTAGQLVASSVESGIRNSSDFRLTTPVGTNQLLIARTAKGGATLTWMCAAWYYSAAGTGNIYYTTSATAISGMPTTTDLSHWTLLDKGVSPVSGTGIFTANAQQLSITFKGLAGTQPPVTITSSAFSRAGATGVPACY
jgi:Tfp pilus assembly protein PilW